MKDLRISLFGKFPSPCGVRRVGDYQSKGRSTVRSNVSVPLRGKEGGGRQSTSLSFHQSFSSVSVPLRGKEGGGLVCCSCSCPTASGKFPSPCGVRRVGDYSQKVVF